MFGIALCQSKKYIEIFSVLLLWRKIKGKRVYIDTLSYDEIKLSIPDFREMTLCPQNDQISWHSAPEVFWWFQAYFDHFGGFKSILVILGYFGCFGGFKGILVIW